MRIKNDLEASEKAGEIHRADSRLDFLLRECKWNQLVTEAARIEDAARKLGWRALDLMKNEHQG